jgi:hypothetical protein
MRLKSMIAMAVVAMASLATPAFAGDLYGGEDGYGPGTADVYGDVEVPYAEAAPETTYVEPRRPRLRSYAPRQRPYRHRPPLYACLAPWQIEDTLHRQGWRRLGRPSFAPGVIGITAARREGLVYRLRVDRCSGVILFARLLDRRRGGGYASGWHDPAAY